MFECYVYEMDSTDGIPELFIAVAFKNKQKYCNGWLTLTPSSLQINSLGRTIIELPFDFMAIKSLSKQTIRGTIQALIVSSIMQLSNCAGVDHSTLQPVMTMPYYELGFTPNGIYAEFINSACEYVNTL